MSIGPVSRAIGWINNGLLPSVENHARKPFQTARRRNIVHTKGDIINDFKLLSSGTSTASSGINSPVSRVSLGEISSGLSLLGESILIPKRRHASLNVSKGLAKLNSAVEPTASGRASCRGIEIGNTFNEQPASSGGWLINLLGWSGTTNAVVASDTASGAVSIDPEFHPIPVLVADDLTASTVLPANTSAMNLHGVDFLSPAAEDPGPKILDRVNEANIIKRNFRQYTRNRKIKLKKFIITELKY
jgi:hypothetical protein